MQENSSILLSKVIIIFISLNSKHSHLPSNLFSNNYFMLFGNMQQLFMNWIYLKF